MRRRLSAEVEELPFRDLQRELKARGLRAAGKKAVLQAAMLDALIDERAGAPAAAGGVPPAASDAPAPPAAAAAVSPAASDAIGGRRSAELPIWPSWNRGRGLLADD